MKKLEQEKINGPAGTSGGNPVGTDFRKIWKFVSEKGRTEKSRNIANSMLNKYL